MTTITRVVARDIRFPTSVDLSGSDAMNEAPDYSAAYVVLETDAGLEGHGFTFTIGRGNELCVAAIRALAPLVEGRTLESFTEDMGAFWRHVTGDSQLRWVGPEKGVIHLATAAIVNAVWDLYAKSERKPLWKLLSDMSPEELIACIDFRYITDAITREEALEILRRNEKTKPDREAEMLKDGFPAYTTSAGWLGYSDEKLRSLVREAVGKGWTHFKMKVGRDIEDDVRRAALIRDEIGPEPHPDDGRQPGLGRGPGHREHGASREVRPVLDRGAHEPRRRPRPRAHSRGRLTRRRRHGRALPEPRAFQAALAGRCHLVLPDRRLPPRRRQRGHRRAADGGEVRRARLPARRRCRTLRVRPASLHLRLHAVSAPRSRTGSWSMWITSTSTSSIPWRSRAAATCRRKSPATPPR